MELKKKKKSISLDQRVSNLWFPGQICPTKLKYYLTLYRKRLPSHALDHRSIFSWCICMCLGLDLGQKRNKGQILDVSYKEKVKLIIIVHPTDAQRIDERRNDQNH